MYFFLNLSKPNYSVYPILSFLNSSMCFCKFSSIACCVFSLLFLLFSLQKLQPFYFQGFIGFVRWQLNKVFRTEMIVVREGIIIPKHTFLYPRKIFACYFSHLNLCVLIIFLKFLNHTILSLSLSCSAQTNCSMTQSLMFFRVSAVILLFATFFPIFTLDQKNFTLLLGFLFAHDS